MCEGRRSGPIRQEGGRLEINRGFGGLEFSSHRLVLPLRLEFFQ